MKKILGIVLSTALALIFTACGSTANTNSSANSTTASTTEQTATETTAEETTDDSSEEAIETTAETTANTISEETVETTTEASSEKENKTTDLKPSDIPLKNVFISLWVFSYSNFIFITTLLFKKALPSRLRAFIAVFSALQAHYL